MRYDQRFSTSAIPHLGHLPGLSCTTSGCMLHVYFTVWPLFWVEDFSLHPLTAIAVTASASAIKLGRIHFIFIFSVFVVMGLLNVEMA